jgi:RimJ/RimL family protein N-acetyltransferase
VEATRSFLQNYDQYEKNGYGRWVVIRKADNEIMGWCGLKFHPESGETDLGYRFFRCYWGQGIASETGKACLEFGFRQLKLKQIVANAMEENGASERVMQKIGMVFREKRDCGKHAGVTYCIDNPN